MLQGKAVTLPRVGSWTLFFANVWKRWAIGHTACSISRHSGSRP